MKKLIIACTLIAIASPVMAGHGNGGKFQNYNGKRPFDFARVTEVQPRYETIEHQIPERQCWVETVSRDVSTGNRNSRTGELLGALIGGGLGNAVGHHKSNKRVGAVVGAVLGASIAHDIKRDDYRGSRVVYEDVERCDVSYRTEYEEQLRGYDVTYTYNNRIYHTFMNEHPGKKIKVAVDVRPVY